MTLSELAKYRLLNQQIAGTKLKSAVEMVTWFAALQAQEYTQTKWALGLRLEHLREAEIEKDFTEGHIIRTHLLRPTWHFVTARDIRWLLALTAPRVNAANAFMYRQMELDKTLFKKCNRILIKILQGGKQLSRDQINEAFLKNKIIARGHRLSYIMMYAELAGIICSGARQGNQFTYALLDERVQSGNSLSPDDALAELTKRFFLSRGPATIKDFSTWSGLTLTECRTGTEMTSSFFIKEVVHGNEYYFSPDTSLNKHTRKFIFLLPVYDEFIVGYKDRNAFLEFRNNLKPAAKFRYDCMIVSDGQIIGTWKRKVAKNSIDLEYEFFRPMNKNQSKQFNNAILRLEEFTSMKVNFGQQTKKLFPDT